MKRDGTVPSSAANLVHLTSPRCAPNCIDNNSRDSIYQTGITRYTRLLMMQKCQRSGVAQALYQTFVQPTLSKTIPRQPNSRYQLPTGRCRPFSTTKPLPRTHAWNSEIEAHRIWVVNPETDKLLESPRLRDDVLRELDPKTHTLVEVGLSPDVTKEEHIPVCKILTRKGIFEAEKRKKAAAKERKKSTPAAMKTIELNWAIDSKDLSHRLSKAVGFLQEGRKLEIVLASKKRGRKASPQECEEVLARVKGLMDEVEGVREVQAFEGKLGGVATWMMQGTLPKKSTGPRESE